MSKIEILQTEENFRLIRGADGRCAVIEARAGEVLSLHGRKRRKAPDTPAGMVEVVGSDGWTDEAAARERLGQMARGERRYAERLW